MTRNPPLSGIQAQQGVRWGGVFASTLHYPLSPFYPNKQAQEAMVQGTVCFSPSCKMLRRLSKEYSIGKRRECDKKTWAVRFKQNSRKIRPGNQVKLFHLMRGIYLDQLAMAGGEGRELLRRIKYKALREYRSKNGWDDRRP
jgi:hypothetical protein